MKWWFRFEICIHFTYCVSRTWFRFFSSATTRKTINSNMIKMRWKNQVFHKVIRVHISYIIVHDILCDFVRFYRWQLMSWCQSWGAQMVIEWKNAKIIHNRQKLSTFLHNLFQVSNILFIFGKNSHMKICNNCSEQCRAFTIASQSLTL